MLDRALAAAGLDRGAVYLTNAVKHFKFGSRAASARIHQTPPPTRSSPRLPAVARRRDRRGASRAVIVCLGATAAQALLGPQFRITKERGQILRQPVGRAGTGRTCHPSAVLRADEPAHADELLAQLIADLTLAARHVQAGTAED